MKNKIVLMAIFCLLFAVGAISAQEKKMSNFAGDWELDANKSKMAERSRIESMTMKVTQSKTDLTIEAKIERAEKEERDMGKRGGFGGRRGMLPDNGTQNTVYSLDGNETKIESPGQFGGDTKFKAEILKDGKLKLIQTRRVESPRGERTIKTVEIWELSNDGKTLTIKRDMETPRGNQSSEMIFMRN